ncbi:hypothetical protein PENSUB_7336 [Penicillium subrubescens]|uniref:Cystathionine gamma-synthase n=1 Tax=Penicillium subrubescens TaxID=1316194 RepID=A0A1Q5TM96_9EURO|nr:hypothetical protein PENSUB_7336 [Penicillium subrubescens]
MAFHRKLVATGAMGGLTDERRLSTELGASVLERFQVLNTNTACALLPSIPAAQRLITSLTVKGTGHFVSPYIQLFVPSTATRDKNNGREEDDADCRWATFYAMLYHSDLTHEAMSVWRETGDGITSRHAEFALEWFQFLESRCINDSFCARPDLIQDEALGKDLPSLPPAATTAKEVDAIKALLAKSAASDIPGQTPVFPRDVFLYPKGLCGIYAVARCLVPDGLAAESQVVIYGWPYAETVKCVERSGWGRVILYGKGTEADLDDLEKKLVAGERIQVLFCELPSNPQLTSPDLDRIRRLADNYGFVVACGETLGTFVNVDILLPCLPLTASLSVFSATASCSRAVRVSICGDFMNGRG